jgi:outer membrane protein TolC/predicted transcriptional regulator
MNAIFNTETIYSILSERTHSAFNRALLFNFKRNGISLTKEQWTILSTLWQKDGCTQQYLANKTYRDKTGTTRIINNLEKQNLVERHLEKNDKRLKLIFLTPQGKALETKVINLVNQTITEAVKGISQENLKIVKDTFAQILSNLEIKNSMKKYLILLITPLLTLNTCFSQIQTSTSLDQAIQKAIEKSSTIKNKEIEIEKLTYQEKGVWNKYIPRVEASALYSYFDNQLTIDLPTSTVPIINYPLFDGKTKFDNYGNIFHGSIMARTVLFSGMQIPNGAKAINQKAIGTSYLKESEKDIIIKDVINTFDQITLLKEIEKRIEDSDKRLKTESKRVLKAIEQGLAIPYDRDKIKLASLEIASKKIELAGKRKLIYKKIQYLTGYSDSEINAVHYKLVPYLITEENLNTQNKQEIKALESFKQAYEYLLKKEKGSYLPTIGAFAGVTSSSIFNANTTTPILPGANQALNLGLNEMTLSPNWMIGAGAKWEIFAGFERKHKVHEAKLNIEQVQNQIEDTKEKLQLLLENNYINYTVNNQKIEIAEQQEQIANNNLTLAIKQYKEGLISISERLEAENEYLKATTNKINILIDQRLSAIETIITTGDLTKKTSK